jgi:serine/threonine protein phosphatase 1
MREEVDSSTMTRTIIIGDIHGCYDELVELMAAVVPAASDRIVSVGDLVDRGPKSPEVVQWFRDRPEAVVLMGNHERKHVRSVLTYAQKITRLQFGDGYDDARAWMATLPYYYETDEVRVVHAAMAPGLPLAEQREEILCGSKAGEKEIRNLFPEGCWHDRYTDAKPVVFGHHVTGLEPLIRDDRVYGIDTGACHGMRLTAVTFPDRKIYAVPAHDDHWTRIKREWQVPVLRAVPWLETSFRDIAEKLDEFRKPSPEIAEYVARMSDWVGELQAAIPLLHAALARKVAGIDPAQFTAAANATSIAPFLFQFRAKRLTVDDLRKRLYAPALVVDLANKLGVAVRTDPP